MITVVLALAFTVGIALAYLIGREDGADAELELWAAAADDQGDRR